MAAIVEKAPFKVALDEDLIGLIEPSQKGALMNTVKPSDVNPGSPLLSEAASSDEWMKAVESHGGEWVITSALESNIGLNAIAPIYNDQTLSLPCKGWVLECYLPIIFPHLIRSIQRIAFHPDKYWDLSQIL